MDFRKLADTAKAELEPLSAGLDLRAALLAAETAELGPGMLGALLAHELVAGHAAMMKLTAKLDRWLALMSDDRLPADQDRGARESVRLAVAAARLTDRYRLGLLSLAKVKGWTAAAARRRKPAADLEDDDPPDGPEGNPPGGPGGTRALLKAMKDLQALNRAYGSALGNGHANGVPITGFDPVTNGPPGPDRPPGPPPAAQARRGKLRHGNPSGDFLAAPRCGARTRAGCPCRQPAMPNGRCRMHGGKSTGARTEAGRARVRVNRLIHGARTAEIIDLRSAAARHARNLKALARLANAANPQFDQSTPCPATSRLARERNTADERTLAQINADGTDARRSHLLGTSASIFSAPRSSAAGSSSRTAPKPRSDRSTPSPATPRPGNRQMRARVG